MGELVDLRSDVVTKPTPAMYDAMAKAQIGEDAWGEDHTVIELENLAAKMTGKEGGLFCVSGTMGNLLCLLAQAGRGTEVIMDKESHLFQSELGGAAILGGLYYRGLPQVGGAIELELLEKHIRSQLTTRGLQTGAVSLENTHLSSGGTALQVSYLKEIRGLTFRYGIPLHIDGARIFNSSIAIDVSVEKIACYADSVSISLSKGLSAPIGSVIVSSKDVIERARAFRKMVGGNMRQVGIIAATGIVALKKMVGRLKQDHQIAKRLAFGLEDIDPSFTNPFAVKTNVVLMKVSPLYGDARSWAKELAGRNILVRTQTNSVLRFMTHRHIDNEEIEYVLSEVKQLKKIFKGRN